MRYLFFFLILLISSCSSDWGNYGGYKLEYDSALDYYIVLDKGKEVYGTNGEDIVRQGTLVKYYKTSGTVDSVFLGKGGIVIESFVDNNNVAFNGKFIILKQKPLKDICECNDSCLTNRYVKNDLSTYKMCQEALEKSVFYQYWIINKIQNAIYGPFTEHEYLKKRKELGVHKELTL